MKIKKNIPFHVLKIIIKSKLNQMTYSDFFPVYLSLFFLLLIVLPLSFFFNVYDSFSDILVEAHGLIFDIIVFGILIQILLNRNLKKRKTEDYEENIKDYKMLKSEEAKVVILRNLNKLINEGKHSIDLTNSSLNNVRFYGLKYFKKSLFMGANMNKSEFDVDLYECSFADSNLKKCRFSNITINSNFNTSNLKGATFEWCNLKDSNFWNSNLKGVLFDNCDFKNCNLEKADIEDAHFFQAKNLSYSQLLKCKNLDKANIPNELINEYNNHK